MTRQTRIIAALALLSLAPAPALAERVCVEELAGTCLKYADPPAAAPARPVSAEEEAERALGLGPEERRRIQSGLRAAGHYGGAVDGAIGPASRRAIASWQRAEGAPATGYLTGPQAQRLAAIAVTGGGAAAPSAPPASNAERDRRREAAMAGLSCYFTARGQPVDLNFRAGGLVIAVHPEGEIDLRWTLGEDRLCVFGRPIRGEGCVDLPESGVDERAMLEDRTRALCLALPARL